MHMLQNLIYLSTWKLIRLLIDHLRHIYISILYNAVVTAFVLSNYIIIYSFMSTSVHKLSCELSCCCCRVHLWAVCLQPFSSNVISWVQLLQPPPSWTVGSCWQYVTLVGVCHKGTCQLQQGPTSFNRMCSGLDWSGNDSGVLYSVWVGQILVAG